jgi:hypothetical protein
MGHADSLILNCRPRSYCPFLRFVFLLPDNKRNRVSDFSLFYFSKERSQLWKAFGPDGSLQMSLERN